MILEKLQDAVIACLESNPYFDDINIVEQRKGVILQDILQALATINPKNGKNGVCLVIRCPSVKSNDDKSHFGTMSHVFEIECAEMPLVNYSKTGTHKPASTIARQVMIALNQFSYPGSGAFSLDDNPLEPLAGVEGVTAYCVSFKFMAQLPAHARCGSPLVQEESGTVVCKVAPLTVAGTEVIPKVWYCEESQGYPSLKNPHAKVFDGTENLAAGFYLFCAYAPGALPSGIVDFHKK